MQETHRIQLFTARAGQFSEIVRTTVFAQLGIAALLCFAQSIRQRPLNPTYHVSLEPAKCPPLIVDT